MPTISEAWRMSFAELAPQIRNEIKALGSCERIEVLRYLLRRKVKRKPRPLRCESAPLCPASLPLCPPLPKLAFKKRNAVLKNKVQRLLASVRDLPSTEALAFEGSFLGKKTMAVGRMQMRKVTEYAQSNLPKEDADLFNAWLGDRFEEELCQLELMNRYHQDSAEHEKALAIAKVEHGKRLERWKAELGVSYRILANIERDVDQYLADPTPTFNVPWLMLPADRSGFAFLDQWLEFQDRLKGGDKERRERIDFARSLIPSHIVKGHDHFGGYLAFVFEWTDSVLLERAENGNAAYIIHLDWMSVSRLSRRQVRELPRQFRDRVVHNNPHQWKWSIKCALQKGRKQ
ncbi:MAG: hypothetical protein K9N47_16760 [Prosthecobacter sp.]|uniref:hypothetical protein n=1 Tax=Prosthecobacter sp. TaxID=1965333 RepID=UPI0025F60364|nr:hypothetical protein [Prosthecobacter sp.]MCF7787783.1 hypothetical protein [Prosthecobacter sp.]